MTNAREAGVPLNPERCTIRLSTISERRRQVLRLSGLALVGCSGGQNTPTATAEAVLGYLLDTLAGEAAGTFASGTGEQTYTVTVRDAGDITGGLNAADAVLGLDGAKRKFARFFDQVFNRARLQRAERPPSHDTSGPHVLPLPPAAGGEFGQAAVYNGEVTYVVEADTWRVTDDRFYTGPALYTANQDIWISNWGGDFFDGRGVPGQNDHPEQ